MTLAPEVRDRLAKLLRLACDRGATDGEKLAAIARTAGMVAAHDLDWDRVLAGVSREEMQQLFDAGYERGVSDTRHEQAKPRPKPDWSPVSGGQVGPDLERVQPILIAAAEAQLDGHLSDFESEFTDSLGIKVCRYGARTFVSNKMWTIIAQLEEKLERLGFIT